MGPHLRSVTVHMRAMLCTPASSWPPLFRPCSVLRCSRFGQQRHCQRQLSRSATLGHLLPRCTQCACLAVVSLASPMHDEAHTSFPITLHSTTLCARIPHIVPSLPTICVPSRPLNARGAHLLNDITCNTLHIPDAEAGVRHGCHTVRQRAVRR
jgi:hypothetical protein